MMGGMAATRMAEAGKEARLKNTKVIEKTRIEEADRAAEEAWRIYESAQQKEGAQNASSQAIKEAYLRALPKDLLERVTREPGVATGMMQRAIRWDSAWAIKRLNKKIEKIENSSSIAYSEI
jgi:LPS O-antigen subunit length determinant protein (WzzB/FepE family)